MDVDTGGGTISPIAGLYALNPDPTNGWLYWQQPSDHERPLRPRYDDRLRHARTGTITLGAAVLDGSAGDRLTFARRRPQRRDSVVCGRRRSQLGQGPGRLHHLRHHAVPRRGRDYLEWLYGGEHPDQPYLQRCGVPGPAMGDLEYYQSGWGEETHSTCRVRHNELEITDQKLCSWRQAQHWMTVNVPSSTSAIYNIQRTNALHLRGCRRGADHYCRLQTR
jgi:hypothetical protein